MEKKPNIILITVDALRADHLGYTGYRKNLSPNIDALAKESVVFNQAYATGPVTPHSFPAILTSTYPLDYQGPNKNEKPRVLISEVLKNTGYITAAFHANPYLSDFFGYNRAWDYFEDLTPSYDVHLAQGKQNIDSRFFKKLLKSLGTFFLRFFPKATFKLRYLFYKLGGNITLSVKKPKAVYVNKIVKEFFSSIKDGEKPFFCWIHYMDIHGPYLPYDCYFKERKLSYTELLGKELPIFFSRKNLTKSASFEKFSTENLVHCLKLYDDGIRYVDEQIGDLFESLKRENLYENTIIILTADHGDEFLEHGGGTHSNKLYNELLKVPLLIRAPGLERKIIDRKTSLINLCPTICNLAGIESCSSFKGKNLFKQGEDIIFHQTGANPKDGWNASLTEINNIKQCKIACQSDNWKYIIDYSCQEEELYNLLTDPKEEKNLAKVESKTMLQMREIINQFIEENPPLSQV